MSQAELRVHSILISLLIRDVHWELYNCDCMRMADVLRNNLNVRSITGMPTIFLMVLAVEFDLPWDEEATRY